MTDEIQKAEDKWERRARIEDQIKAETHEINKRDFQRREEGFALGVEAHRAALEKDAAIVEQARSVATMANNVANLSRVQEEGQSIANRNSRLAEAREQLVEIPTASVRASWVIAVIDHEERQGWTRVLCRDGVTFAVPTSRDIVVKALTELVVEE